MNWRLIIVAAIGLLLGMALSPFEHGKVSAAVTAPSGAHFQLLSATVDEAAANQNGTGFPFGQTGRMFPYHELFLLDTQNGKVWEYASGTTVTEANGSKVYSPSTFVPIERSPQN